MLADWIFIFILLGALGLGALLGFGKVVTALFFNKITRIIVAVFVCYSFGGLILGIPFVNQMLADLAANWAGSAFLTYIHLEIIIYYIVLFIITILLVFILSKIVKGISEANVLPLKIVNKVGGAVLFAAFVLLVMLLVFQIISWIGGATAQNFSDWVAGGLIMKPLYESNPLAKIVLMVQK